MTDEGEDSPVSTGNPVPVPQTPPSPDPFPPYAPAPYDTSGFDAQGFGGPLLVPEPPSEPLFDHGGDSHSPAKGFARRAHRVYAWLAAGFHARFIDRDPSFLGALGPFLMLAGILFTRWPGTNYIFDEQEALLANPYVNATGGLRYVDAIHRDFWGLPPDRSIGSYRPIPNLLWRAIWQLSSKPDGLFRQPFLHHVYNVLLHAVNAAIVTALVWAWTRRRGPAWLAGLAFASCAVLTEAISGIVGIADVLGGLGALLALAALSLPAYSMPFAVFIAVSFGLFSKESALVCVPLVPFAALLVAPLTHPERPARFARAALALVGAAAAFVVYVELRKRWFPSPLPKELVEGSLDDDKLLPRLAHEFLVWFHQAPLPKDPLNNPFADADKPHRIAGALRVYGRGLLQIVFPSPLSGDYSFPQEPVPDRLVFPWSVAGAAFMVLPPLASFLIWLRVMVVERRRRRESDETRASGSLNQRIAGLACILLSVTMVALDLLVLRRRGLVSPDVAAPVWAFALLPGALGAGLVVQGMPTLARPDPRALGYSGLIVVAVGITWAVVSYFPHSNIPVVLPTVRAERFWYFPAIGTSMTLGVLFAWLAEQGHASRFARATVPLLFAFFAFQWVQAYRHAADYRSDVDFWRATKDAVPRSAKAHLNYSVMKGARGDLETRLAESRIALALAPKWPMAHIYTGDTLCRLHRAPEAWRYYEEGFDLGPNDLSLIALALQCLYDEHELLEHADALRAIAERHEGSWIAYLATDTLANYETNKGVNPKYRPRGYNEGPKD